MKVLVTGDRGYIGSVLVPILLSKQYSVVGYDIGFFAENTLEIPNSNYLQITKDIRDVTEKDLQGIESIIHLASMSNDPLGELNPEVTKSINFLATIKLAKLAKKVGVKRFVFASSQSIYGVSNADNELDEDTSIKNPITAYANAKWESEKALNEICSDEFIVSSFRPSTVFGPSPRLRCDIVFNNFLASAFTSGKIEIMSDGKPWRPIVHIEDVCSALISGLEAPANLLSGKAFNVGIKNGNYTVFELAKAAQEIVKESQLVFTADHKDSRTYKVSFNKIYKDLGDYYKPKWSLENGGIQLFNFYNKVHLTEAFFKGRKTIRLKQIDFLKNEGFIDNKMRKI